MKKIDFYNIFQRYKVVLGVLGASNLQDQESISLFSFKNLHKKSSKPRSNLPKNILKVSWGVSNKSPKFS
jgi:hypothetical protein